MISKKKKKTKIKMFQKYYTKYNFYCFCDDSYFDYSFSRDKYETQTF